MVADTALDAFSMRMVCVPGSNSNHRDCGVMGSFVGVVDVAVAESSGTFMRSVPTVQYNKTRLPPMKAY